MANRARPTRQKRDKEKARLEKRKYKAERRLEAQARRAVAVPRTGSEDPDIAGIRLGPQPPLED